MNSTDSSLTLVLCHRPFPSPSKLCISLVIFPSLVICVVTVWQMYWWIWWEGNPYFMIDHRSVIHSFLWFEVHDWKYLHCFNVVSNIIHEKTVKCDLPMFSVFVFSSSARKSVSIKKKAQKHSTQFAPFFHKCEKQGKSEYKVYELNCQWTF